MNSKEITNVKPALWTKAFIMVTLSNFFLSLSFYLLLPTLPIYVAEKGGDSFAVGLVISIFTVSALLTRPFAGKALDSVGRSKVLFIGLLIFIASTLGYYWMATVLLILVLRLVHGIGWGIVSTAYGTIASDIVPRQRRGEGLGYFGLANNLGVAFAPLIGIWLVNQFGFLSLFSFAVSMGIVAFFLIFSINYQQDGKSNHDQEIEENQAPQENREDEKGKRVQLESNVLNLFRGLVEKEALFPSTLMMLITITYGGIVSFITLFGLEVGIENVGWYFLANALTLMLIRPLAGILFDKKGHRWVLIPGALFSALGLFVLSSTQSVLGLITAAILYGVGFGSIQPSLLAWTINCVSVSKRGSANATFFSAFDLGISVGALVLGIVAEQTSYSQMYFISMLAVLLFFSIYITYLLKQKAA